MDNHEVSVAQIPALRPYQIKAKTRVLDLLAAGKHPLLIMPTGTGKTVVYGSVLLEYYKAKKPALVIAHRVELLEQGRETMLRFGVSEFDISIIGGAYGCDRKSGDKVPLITFASKDFLQGKRLQLWGPNDFQLLVIDESHHSVAKTYKNIIGRFRFAKMFGVTATPNRLDGKKVLGEVFSDVAFFYDIKAAVEDEFLVPIRQIFVNVDTINLSEIKTRKGDFVESELEKQMLRASTVHRIVAATIDAAQARPTLIFACSIQHAREIARIGNGYTESQFQVISGLDNPKDRARILADFRARKFQFLVNRDLVTEGIDIPEISCVAMARPTKSVALYTQAIGRGTRLLGKTLSDSKANGKEDLLVIDFVGNSKTYTLVSTVDCLEPNAPERVKKWAAKILENNPKMTTLSALGLAQKRHEDQERAAKQLAADAIAGKVNYKQRLIDPFRDAKPSSAPSNASQAWREYPLTDKQKKTLLKAGIKPERLEQMKRGEASEILDRIFDRTKKNLATIKQREFLIKKGITVELSFEDASQIITEIQRNDWRATPEIRHYASLVAIK